MKLDDPKYVNVVGSRIPVGCPRCKGKTRKEIEELRKAKKELK